MKPSEILYKKEYLLPASILVSAIILAASLIFAARLIVTNNLQTHSNPKETSAVLEFGENVVPSKGVGLPVKWGDIGVKLTNAGVIDTQKFETIYAERGGLSEEAKKLLYASDNGNLVITHENSGILLNLLWALGLANKNKILETGPMNDPQYGGAGGFASTGGWTLAKGDAMDHYSKHPWITLTPKQQALVERVSKNIYRPCCNNSTHFPDCNHGMAMLGLLELIASQGIPEEKMYKIALQVNSYWFPDTYLTIAKYLGSKGISWKEALPKEILGANYSSSSGYQKILSEIEPVESRSAGGCGV